MVLLTPVIPGHYILFGPTWTQRAEIRVFYSFWSCAAASMCFVALINTAQPSWLQILLTVSLSGLIFLSLFASPFLTSCGSLQDRIASRVHIPDMSSPSLRLMISWVSSWDEKNVLITNAHNLLQMLVFKRHLVSCVMLWQTSSSRSWDYIGFRKKTVSTLCCFWASFDFHNCWV